MFRSAVRVLRLVAALAPSEATKPSYYTETTALCAGVSPTVHKIDVEHGEKYEHSHELRKVLDST